MKPITIYWDKVTYRVYTEASSNPSFHSAHAQNVRDWLWQRLADMEGVCSLYILGPTPTLWIVTEGTVFSTRDALTTGLTKRDVYDRIEGYLELIRRD